MPSVGGGIRYYDDNVWVGLNLVLAYGESGDRRLLRAAKGTLKFQRTGEWRTSDPPDQRRYPGGVYWNVNRRFRPLNSTAGTAELALELYAATHNRRDLALGKQEYQWARRTLLAPSGTYRQRVDPGGTVIGSAEDNGDGFMVRAGMLLYQLTRQKLYLDEAIQTTIASLKHYPPSVLEHTCPAYNASFLFDLMRLNGVARLHSVTQSLDAYATWAAKHTNRLTGAFHVFYPGHCQPAAPQAGATGALILQAVG
jgi:hypothetical protein